MSRILRTPVDAGVMKRRADWYWDHDKRLDDAIIAQSGRPEAEGVHADGIHKWDDYKWR
jgi:hypothetical protein